MALSAALPDRWRRLRRHLGVLRRLPPAERRAAIARWLESRAQREARLHAALALPAARLLFVCHGNIMRSAFAQAHAVAVAAQRHPSLAVRLLGAGTHATAGALAHPDAIAAAGTLDVSLKQHRARPLAGVPPASDLLVICMDRANEARAVVWAGVHGDQVFLIGDIAEADAREVLDPYGRGAVATLRAFERVRDHVDAWLARLEREWWRS